MAIENLLYFIAGIIAMATFGEAPLPLPKFIKPCSRNDPKLNDCALKSGIPIVSLFKDGIPKYRIPAIDPLIILELKINEDKSLNKPLGFNLVGRDLVCSGLHTAQLKKIRIELDPPHFRTEYYIPRAEMIGKYNIDGKILLLPIKGDGDANVTIVGMDLQFEFGGVLEKKADGKEYISIKNTHMDFTSERTYMQLNNLFNGDEALGKRMNEFLNENWRELNVELGTPIANALADVFKIIVEGITNNVPFDEIFPEKV